LLLTQAILTMTALPFIFRLGFQVGKKVWNFRKCPKHGPKVSQTMAQSHTEALPNHLLHFKFSCCLLPNFLLVFINPGSQGSGTGMQLFAGICHSSLVAFCGLSPCGTFGHAGCGQNSTDRQHLIICTGFGAPIGTFGATAAGDEHQGEPRTSCQAKNGCNYQKSQRVPATETTSAEICSRFAVGRLYLFNFSCLILG